jgi:hypothetical protein
MPLLLAACILLVLAPITFLGLLFRKLKGTKSLGGDLTLADYTAVVGTVLNVVSILAAVAASMLRSQLTRMQMNLERGKLKH